MSGKLSLLGRLFGHRWDGQHPVRSVKAVQGDDALAPVVSIVKCPWCESSCVVGRGPVVQARGVTWHRKCWEESAAWWGETGGRT